MIKDQFLPTSITSGIFELTDVIRNMTGADPAKPYYMGYVKDEDFPSMWKFSYWVPDLDAGKITITQVNENRPWGFTVANRVNYYYGTSLVNDGNGNWVFFGSTYNIVDTRLINKAEMARVTMTQYMIFTFRIVAKSGTYTWNYNKNYTQGFNKTYTDFLAFINGEQTWTISTPNDGTIDINYSDFNDSGWAELPTSNNVVYYVWLIEARFPYGNTNAAGNSDNKVVPFYRSTVGDLGRYAYIAPSGYAAAGAAISSDTVSINGTTWQITNYTTRAYGVPCGLPPAELDIEQIVNVCVPRGGVGLVSGRYFLMWNNTNEYLAYFVPYLFKDVKSWLSNFNKFWTGTVYDFPPTIDTYTSATFVDLYNTDNTPKYEISTLPFGSALDKILQPWQKPAYDISEDEFNADTDIPGGGSSRPDPDLPDLPGDEEHGGDNIEPNDTTGIGGGFGFMTQYALRASDLQELGKKLWAGFDPDNPDIDSYLSNFIYKISTDTGSVNFADIMDFFVSLRFYPFPLGNISTITTSGHDMYIGAGTEPLTFTNNIHTMDSFEGIINAGELNVPFWYGDFRDYQTQITLYLPYCGTAELNPVDVMGSTLECFYEVDFCTGSCTGYVWCTTWDGARYCVASLPGQLGADVPMSASNAGRVASRIMGDRITFTENLVSILRHGAGFAGAAASGNVGSAIDRAFSAFITPTIAEEKRLNDELGKGAISAPVLGSGGGFAAYKNPSTAYIQVRSAFYPDVANYPDTVGNPASETVTIGDCSGFCRFVNVDVSDITADLREQNAIRQALENGVIL